MIFETIEITLVEQNAKFGDEVDISSSEQAKEWIESSQ